MIIELIHNTDRYDISMLMNTPNNTVPMHRESVLFTYKYISIFSTLTMPSNDSNFLLGSLGNQG